MNGSMQSCQNPFQELTSKFLSKGHPPVRVTWTVDSSLKCPLKMHLSMSSSRSSRCLGMGLNCFKMATSFGFPSWKLTDRSAIPSGENWSSSQEKVGTLVAEAMPDESEKFFKIYANVFHRWIVWQHD